MHFILCCLIAYIRIFKQLEKAIKIRILLLGSESSSNHQINFILQSIDNTIWNTMSQIEMCLMNSCCFLHLCDTINQIKNKILTHGLYSKLSSQPFLQLFLSKSLICMLVLGIPIYQFGQYGLKWGSHCSVLYLSTYLCIIYLYNIYQKIIFLYNLISIFQTYIEREKEKERVQFQKVL